MKCYHCGAEVKKIPIEEHAKKSREIAEKNLKDIDEGIKKAVIIAGTLFMHGSYGQFKCENCKKPIGTTELIGKNLFKVEPMPDPVELGYAIKEAYEELNEDN